MAVGILVAALSCVMVLRLMYVASEPIIIYGEDKTFIESTGQQERYPAELYGSDILEMLINTDQMNPYPKAIRINNAPVIKLDNAFVTNKMKVVASIYAANGQYRLSTMLDYKVTDSYFVYDDGPTPYIQLKLEAA